MAVRSLALIILSLFAGAVRAEEAPLSARILAQLKAAVPGARFGMVVTDETGREIVSIDPDGRYIPASNTKIFTTAAAFATLGDMTKPDAEGGTAVSLRADVRGRTDVIIEGTGDARLSSAADCIVDCLATLADAVAARMREVRDIIGDATLYPDERWSPGMSWNNIPTDSGTGISALSLDDNEIVLTVTPTVPGAVPAIAGLPYYTIDNRAVTLASGGITALDYDRVPNGKTLLVSGTIAADAPAQKLTLGIDDPAHYAAWRFKTLLQARGVRVYGTVTSVYRPLLLGGAPNAAVPIARLTAPPLLDDLTQINKLSQNLHAELLLRRIGRVSGQGAIGSGLAVVRAMLADARIPRIAYDLSDGSGMSTYNRVAPRGVVAFLRWAQRQPWGTAWRKTLPMSGEGTLARRFGGTPLAANIAAKTGALNATAALAGYFTANSGRALTFAIYANDVPDGASATSAIDAALLTVAASN